MSDNLRKTVYVVFDLNSGWEDRKLENFIKEHVEKIMLPFEEVAVKVFLDCNKMDYCELLRAKYERKNS